MSYRVLLVDDEPNVTASLKRALRREPYDLLSVQSAEEALELMTQTPVDVVVADERMPGMSGADLLAIIRRTHPDTVRMMLTGYTPLNTAVTGLGEGDIQQFLTKPCSEVELAARIRRVIEQKARPGPSAPSTSS